MGSPSSFGRKRPFISLNSTASIENLSISERARARARANHAINDAQKGSAMQLNGITLTNTLMLHLQKFAERLLKFCLRLCQSNIWQGRRVKFSDICVDYFCAKQ